MDTTYPQYLNFDLEPPLHDPWNLGSRSADGTINPDSLLYSEPPHQLAAIHRVVPGLYHAPILIEKDEDFVSQGWPGSGTAMDPYRIENLDINHTGLGVHGIAICQTRVHFVIRNCLIRGVLSRTCSAIYLQNVMNGWLDNNTCTDTDPDPATGGGYEGVWLRDSAQITITQNTLVNNYNSIYIWTSNDITVANNSCSYSRTGIDVSFGCTSTRIANNTFDHNSVGIRVHYCGGNNSLENNVFVDTYAAGICIESTPGISLAGNRLEGTGFYFSFDAVPSSQMEVLDNSVNGKPLTFWQNRIGGVVPEGSGQIVLMNCSDVMVSSQTLNNCTLGVAVFYSKQITLVNNSCKFNRWGGISLARVESSQICNNTCEYNGDQPGISASASHGNWIANNRCVNGTAGILLWGSNGDAVINNTCSETRRMGLCCTGGYGIYVRYGNDSTVVNNTCDGTYFYDSHSNRIVGNTLTQNLQATLHLECSSNNTVVDNRLVNSGLYLQGWSPSECRQFLVENNTVNGRPLVFWQDHRDETVPASAGQVVLVSCSNVTVTNQVLSYCGWAILLAWCNESRVSHNTCTDGIRGISLLGTNTTQITYNVCSRNNCGIYKEQPGAWSNTISHNTCTFNRGSGIYLDSWSYSSLVGGNTCSHNGGAGIFVIGSSHTVTSNVCVNNSWDGIRIIGSGSVTNNTCQENSEDGIWLTDGSGTVAFNRCTRNGVNGIHLEHWNFYVAITGNVCTDNGGSGICLTEAYNCSVTYNLSANNALAGIFIGVWCLVDLSADNNVTFNVFAFNGAWNGFDNGTANRFDYNFWQDYRGTDFDANGIGDTPYLIPGTAGNLDPHPLLQWPGAPSVSPLLRLALIGGTAALTTIALATTILWRRTRPPHHKKRAP